MLNTRYSIADNSPEAAAERNVPRNPRPLCRDFVAQEAPSAFWCATCRWNRPMHDDEAHRAAIAAELAVLNSRPAENCNLCRHLGHEESNHPLPKDHPQYDAFYDATDDELAGMVSNAVWPNGRALYDQDKSVSRPYEGGGDRV